MKFLPQCKVLYVLCKKGHDDGIKGTILKGIGGNTNTGHIELKFCKLTVERLL